MSEFENVSNEYSPSHHRPVQGLKAQFAIMASNPLQPMASHRVRIRKRKKEKRKRNLESVLRLMSVTAQASSGNKYERPGLAHRH